MTTEPGGEAAVVETTKAAPEAAVLSQEPKERDWEAEAKEYGWVPQEQFKGDAEKWRPAEEFVRRGEEILPIVRKQNEKLTEKVKDLEATNERMSRMFEKTIERERAKANAEIATLKAAKKEAIKAGDAEEVERIEGAIENISETVKDDEPGKKGHSPVAGSAEHVALIRDFNKANAWMIEEPEMGEYAEKFSERNAAANEDISFEDNMKATVAAVRKKFPGYFKDSTTSTTAANGHAAVDSGGSFYGGPVRDDTYGLNKIELEQADKDIAAKLYKNRKEWARVYRGQ